jgi:2-methylcitrate dehydratase PrpD
MPIQAAAQALSAVLGRPGVDPAAVERVDVRLPSHGARIVDNRSMPDIHLQYVLSLLLLDGDITFESAHDYERRERPEVQAMIDRINLVHDPSLDPPHRPNTRVAALTATFAGGRIETHVVDAAFGSRLNPMDWPTLERKAADILSSALSRAQAAEFIAMICDLESVERVRDLRPFLTTC